MKQLKSVPKKGTGIILLFLSLSACFSAKGSDTYKEVKPTLHYTVSMPDPSSHFFHIELFCNGWIKDTIDFKMPRWMPGYYQIMEYAREVRNYSAREVNGKVISVTNTNQNTWRIVLNNSIPFRISYDVKADRKFVANSYLDTTHGYIVPSATFMYINGFIKTPVNLTIKASEKWNKIATGLEPVPGKSNEFYAPDFDILYDCPVLIGDLEKLPSFEVNGIQHRFICYNPGNFDREAFISNLKKVIREGVGIIGDIPYTQYTFIGIGQGYGGIEHLNNTTVSFNGTGLDRPEAMNRIMKFLAHEYFHHYNVKRIRPYELGPFDYDRENRTNLLWVSEGLSVYYEYLIVKRAGMMSEREFFGSFESNINAFENDPGRHYQSLSQASFNTWSDGPFGNKKEGDDRSISYYDKGPLMGLILDLAIRNATKNKKSLDDVMRLMYWQYYKKMQRGFTDAEFQQACEDIAGISLSREFEYVYTTGELDYSAYLTYAGLKITEDKDVNTGKRRFTINRQENMSNAQATMLQAWAER
ncbi:MAG: hypothetical protein A2X05_09440 [Bacteroidetes bacterium GWE2_41_25]|nr:MAG: hypothetical protein A2X03_05150 [Bacteroidetes bacterium GWA2_40_15]OFX92845.1 MAG: hypothetical protein A2X06_02370 [Bacteroidetes bacterium GWC2_40_22]OFY05493.1 MAG: hypothetical protein A2X05_09440 [Bacteroidetes bacterium GWE2_41_25]OFY57156.1 MAG: hypothetical protein A2X04_04655 [Bacteroidetes bacterium GWF2_41_9]HAM10111.1 peptidase M61 [Bacteroidales bacterium]